MKRVTFNPKDSGDNLPTQRERSPLQCVADSCKWQASASFGGAPWACVAHQGVEDARDWPSITRRTAEFQWLADFIAEIQRGINFPKPGANWQRSAEAFFADSEWPWLAPNARECGAPDLYINRLLAEARALAQGKPRPAPFVPHAQTQEWQRTQRKPLVGSDQT